MVPHPTIADDEYEDIQQATGMEWSHLLSLLIYCGLITFRVDSMVKEGTVLVEQWEELGQAILRHVQLQITQICSKGGDQIVFFVLITLTTLLLQNSIKILIFLFTINP